MRTSHAREQHVIQYSDLKFSYVHGIGTGPDLRVRACARSPGPGAGLYRHFARDRAGVTARLIPIALCTNVILYTRQKKKI